MNKQTAATIEKIVSKIDTFNTHDLRIELMEIYDRGFSAGYDKGYDGGNNEEESDFEHHYGKGCYGQGEYL